MVQPEEKGAQRQAAAEAPVASQPQSLGLPDTLSTTHPAEPEQRFQPARPEASRFERVFEEKKAAQASQVCSALPTRLHIDV